MFYKVDVSFVRLYILILCVAYFCPADGATSFENISGNVTKYDRHRRQANCLENSFRCNSGECIIEDYLCDGKEDCQDFSDETDCLNTPCNRFLFKCAYGACINKELECDGQKNCKDNSDESHCNKNICRIDQFQCNSGQCIPESGQCVGKAHCTDNSDESEEICSLFPCPRSTFSCKYGACVDKEAKCNGVNECLDGSDEASCPNAQLPQTTNVAPPTKHSCVMPNNPVNGAYTIGASPAGTYKPGAYVNEYLILVTNCKPGYKPSPPDDQSLSYCVKGNWSPRPHTCSRSCPGVSSTKTTNVTCTYQTRATSCDNPIQHTFATITCADLHEEPSVEQKPYRVCKDGSWDNPFPQCYPVCGEKRPRGRTNIVGSTEAKDGDYPWHVGLYLSTTKEYICGGSILNERVVLSAAHCFINADNDNPIPRHNYVIATGKYYRVYDDPRDKNPQYSSIDAIYVPGKYKGGVNYHEADIAVVILTNKLIPSTTVQPVCIDWSSWFEDEQLNGIAPGVVVGWGYTVEGDKPSEVLKELIIPVVPYDRCYYDVPKAFRRFITPDKVCAGFLGEGKSVCEGDSGGGLTFANVHDRYYIRGIVSTSPSNNEGHCDSNQLSTFTKVSTYIEFIKQYALYYS